MYFAFIDESGNPNPKDTNNQFYVLLALIMHEKGFPYLYNYTKSLRREIWDFVNDFLFCTLMYIYRILLIVYKTIKVRNKGMESLLD